MEIGLGHYRYRLTLMPAAEVLEKAEVSLPSGPVREALASGKADAVDWWEAYGDAITVLKPWRDGGHLRFSDGERGFITRPGDWVLVWQPLPPRGTRQFRA